MKIFGQKDYNHMRTLVFHFVLNRCLITPLNVHFKVVIMRNIIVSMLKREKEEIAVPVNIRHSKKNLLL